MHLKRPSGRKIAVYVAVLMISIAGFCLLSVLVNRMYFWHGARFSCPFIMSVDLSKTGTYTASCNHWFPLMSHGILGLDVHESVLAKTPPNILLTGLKGTWSIADHDGSPIYEGKLVEDPNYIKMPGRGHVIELYTLGSWYGKLNWQIDITVTQGAYKLEGIPHRLVFIDTMEASRALNEVDLPRLFITCATLPVAIVIVAIIASRASQEKKRPQNDKILADSKVLH